MAHDEALKVDARMQVMEEKGGSVVAPDATVEDKLFLVIGSKNEAAVIDFLGSLHPAVARKAANAMVRGKTPLTAASGLT